MADLDVSSITSWHAHVYFFDSVSRDAAWKFREAVAARFRDTVQLGSVHERPVGPHPLPSYQIGFTSTQFAEVVPWLTLNHGALDLFVHPNTADELRDHRDRAIWLGRSHQLDLRAVGG